MDPIPAKVDRFFISAAAKIDKTRVLYFLVLALLIALIGAILWGLAAMESSRQFRLLTLIAPLLLSYLIHVFSPNSENGLLIFLGCIAWALTLFAGKFIIFSHFFSTLPVWIESDKMSDLQVAFSYVAYIFNKTQMNLFISDISKVLDKIDVLWSLAGVYIIWRHMMFSPKRDKYKENEQNRKYIKRRFK